MKLKVTPSAPCPEMTRVTCACVQLTERKWVVRKDPGVEFASLASSLPFSSLAGPYFFICKLLVIIIGWP